jgi:uncharacterized protein YcaQ
VTTLSAVEARRLAIHAQLLDADRPSAMPDVVHRLTGVQHDPTAAVAPSADLVLWSRLGPEHSPEELRDALDEQRLLELGNMIHPLRVRLPAGDVQAGRETPLGLLGDADPVRRPARRQA